MDDQLGDIPDGDVLVQDNRIADVGAGIDSGDAPVIDARGTVVLPGLVETHWHLWSCILRGLVGEGEGRGYFPIKNRLAPHFEPVDTYRSTRLGLAEAADSGITTVHNWHHNLRSPEDADAAVQAMVDSGLRGRFSYGNADRLPKDELMDLDDAVRLREEWGAAPSGDRLSFGLALRGPIRTLPEVNLREWRFGRDVGLPITIHCGGRRGEPGRYCDLVGWAHEHLLGPDVQVVHAVSADSEEIALLASTGTHISLSPTTELLDGGMPPVSELLEAGVLTSLSIDTTAFPMRADLFLQMRLVYSMTRSAVDGPEPPTARRLLKMATIDGARDLGLDAQIGSLTVGKLADLVLIRLNDLNMAPGADPVLLSVLTAGPWNVDTVIADGRILKRAGRLTTQDPAEVAENARGSLVAILQRAQLDPASVFRSAPWRHVPHAR